MKKLSLLLTIIFSLSKMAYSIGDFDRTTEFQKRSLYVVLKSENTDYMNSLSENGDTELIETHKANVALNNSNLKSIFSESWTETPVEFINESDLEAMSEDDLSKVSILNYRRYSQEKIEFFRYIVSMAYFKKGKKDRVSFETNKKFFKVSLMTDVPTLADMRFLLSKMKILYKFEEAYNRDGLEKNLKGKTLLIDKSSVEMSSSEIKEAYSFPFKRLSNEEVQALIDSRDPNSLYLKLDIDGEGRVNFLMLECETGQIISRCHITGIAKVTINAPSQQHMKKYGSYQCSYCSFTGKEIFRLYTAKAKLKKAQLKYMSSKAKQVKFFKYLMLY